jgi:hypothetical protein
VEFHAGLKTVERGERECWPLPLRRMLLLLLLLMMMMMMTVLEGMRMKCLLQRTKCRVTALLTECSFDFF